MNGMSDKAAGVSGLPLVILLSLSMTSGAWAADAAATPAAAAAQPGAEQLEELEQIWIRGKSLSRVINEAEDAFFAAYNKVNRNRAFRITCGEVSLHPGSMIMRRACVPGFLADANSGLRAGSIPIPSVVHSGCGQASGGRYSGSNYATNDFCASSWSVNIPPVNVGPSPAALIAAHANDLAVHMMMLINRDPQLKQMAGHLDDLHREFKSMQTQYERIRPPQPDAKPARLQRGPRVL
jgi:hypothetical protein